jgi:hypothetical protein
LAGVAAAVAAGCKEQESGQDETSVLHCGHHTASSGCR